MDQLTVKKAQNGDKGAREKLFEEHQNLVYSVALRLMMNREDALDAAQEAFIKIMKGLPGFKWECALSSWIYRITVNTCMDMLRKRKRGALTEELNDYGIAAADSSVWASPELSLEANERLKSIKQGLAKLDDAQRAIIILRDVQGLSYDKIADILQINTGTVKSRLNRARIKLASIIRQMELF